MKYFIPIFTKEQDSFIRKSYFGGGVHVFKSFAKKVYHYDINSLYPFVMLKAMPFELIKIFIPDTKFRLNDNFFGFCKVEITISSNCKLILLPQRINDKVVYQSGTFVGIYFSEELKLYSRNSYYKIKFLELYEFNKFYPFKEFVDTFYNIKVNSKGVERFISKGLLNNLYGFFGRKYDILETISINNEHLESYLRDFNIKHIETKDNYSTITYISDSNYHIKANVAISSAITSYARIHMHPFLLLNSTLYSDTDSLFSSKPLPSKYIGKEIGLFKDELKGKTIQKVIFLGPKRYGYWFYDENNNRIEKSVYAGVERDSLTFNQIKKLYKK